MNKVLLSVVAVMSAYFMVVNFLSVFLEEEVDEMQRAHENLVHRVLGHTGDTIVLETREVRLVLDKSSADYIGQWRARSAHFLSSALTLIILTIFYFLNRRVAERKSV